MNMKQLIVLICLGNVLDKSLLLLVGLIGVW